MYVTRKKKIKKIKNQWKQRNKVNNKKKIALRLRENKNINGIKVKIDDKAHIIKISQLADDTTLFVSSKTYIALAMNEIEIFG
jgi:dihydrodipicolinate synthase/N-acetylneuraminate lyase